MNYKVGDIVRLREGIHKEKMVVICKSGIAWRPYEFNEWIGEDLLVKRVYEDGVTFEGSDWSNPFVPNEFIELVGEDCGEPDGEVDMVNEPPHYTIGEYQAIDVIEDWGLGFHLGNAVKYISRSGHKYDAIEDLKKAVWYINKYIELAEEEAEDGF